MLTAQAARAGICALVMMSATAAPTASVQSPTLVALARVEPGGWALRIPGERGPERRLCVNDARALLQLRHATQVGCSRFVIANEANVATVHYTCPGAGHGRTTITVTTPRALRIETQGIAGNQPFDTVFEARRSGAC